MAFLTVLLPSVTLKILVDCKTVFSFDMCKRSCVNRMQKIQMNSPSAHFGPATGQNSSSIWPNLSLTSTSLESKCPPSSASVSLEMILVVFPVGFVRKKLNCNPLIFGFAKETVSVVLSYNHLGCVISH